MSFISTVRNWLIFFFVEPIFTCFSNIQWDGILIEPNCRSIYKFLMRIKLLFQIFEVYCSIICLQNKSIASCTKFDTIYIKKNDKVPRSSLWFELRPDIFVVAYFPNLSKLQCINYMIFETSRTGTLYNLFRHFLTKFVHEHCQKLSQGNDMCILFKYLWL